MSPDDEGNFISRWGVETIAISRLMDDRPRRMLYEVLASITKYKADVAFSIDPLTHEADNVVVVRHHLGLSYPHCLEGFPVEDMMRKLWM